MHPTAASCRRCAHTLALATRRPRSCLPGEGACERIRVFWRDATPTGTIPIAAPHHSEYQRRRATACFRESASGESIRASPLESVHDALRVSTRTLRGAASSAVVLVCEWTISLPVYSRRNEGALGRFLRRALVCRGFHWFGVGLLLCCMLSSSLVGRMLRRWRRSGALRSWSRGRRTGGGLSVNHGRQGVGGKEGEQRERRYKRLHEGLLGRNNDSRFFSHL